METKVKGVVRGGSPVFGDGSEAPIQLTRRGAQFVSLDGLPREGRLTDGASYATITATAATPVVAIPTTSALLELQNLNSDRNVVIEVAFAVITTATAAVQAMGILLNVGLCAKAAIADTLVIQAMRAGGRRSRCRAAVGTTIAAGDGGAANNWFPWGTSGTPVNTTQVGQVLEARVDGGIILPPGFSLGMTILSGAATATSVQLGLRWDEVPI